MKLIITTQDIEKARLETGATQDNDLNCYLCPVAQAAIRIFKEKFELASSGELFCTDRKIFNYSNNLKKQVRNFDKNGSFKPGTYILTKNS